TLVPGAGIVAEAGTRASPGLGEVGASPPARSAGPPAGGKRRSAPARGGGLPSGARPLGVALPAGPGGAPRSRNVLRATGASCRRLTEGAGSGAGGDKPGSGSAAVAGAAAVAGPSAKEAGATGPARA